MRGKFITFEGGEGAGKTTQIARLGERLADADISVVTTREPGGTPAAEAIRTLLLGGKAERFGPRAEALMFAIARADHVDTVIAPALATGSWVLCDRFFDSTRVYQGDGDGVDADYLSQLEEQAVGDTRPDLTIVLDLPAELGLSRMGDRSAANGEGPDRFERERAAVHEARRQAFLDIASREPGRCAVVSAEGRPDEVAEAVWQVVQDRLAPGAG